MSTLPIPAAGPHRIALVLGIAVLGTLAALLWPRPGYGEGGNSITSPDTAGDVGWFTSLALDADGNPIVSYNDRTNEDLKVLHCNDPDCSGDDESITSPDRSGDVGRYTSLELDASGNPVVSYYDETNEDLKVLHCNDPDCSGDDESITSPDTADEVGSHTSLALDASGNPAVSYYDETNEDLKVLRCNDPNCSGGDESITSPDTAGEVGTYTSLALDASGNPVVGYYDVTNGDLKVLHCNDPNCSGADESITSPDTSGDVGRHAALVLDASGYPVVAYYDFSNADLNVLHCNDPNCSGDDESVTSPDDTFNVGSNTSLALDGAGNPVVSYFEATSGVDDLRVLHCNDPNCSGGDDSVSSPDPHGDVGRFTSLALDADGYPVVSYFYWVPSYDLKVLHCDDPQCRREKAAPAPTATADPGPSSTPAPPSLPTQTPVDGVEALPETGGNGPSGDNRAGVSVVAFAAAAAGIVALGGVTWYRRRRHRRSD